MKTLAEKFVDYSYTMQGKRLVQSLFLAQQVGEKIEKGIDKAVKNKNVNEIEKARNEAYEFLYDKLIEGAVGFYAQTANLLDAGINNKLGDSMASKEKDRAEESIRIVTDAISQSYLRIRNVLASFVTKDPINAWAKIFYKPPTVEEIDRIIDRKQFVKRMEKDLVNKKSIQTAIIDGFSKGKAPRQIARDIRPLVGDVVTAKRVARTESHRISQRMVEKSFNDMAGPLISGYKYVATLDARTRNHHAERDGKVFSVKQKRPVLPDGYNCRCTYAPVAVHKPTSKFAALNIDYTKSERASIDGPVSKHTRYPQWFNRQSAATKKSIIGVGNYDKLRSKSNNGVNWQDFASMKKSPARRKPERTQKGRKVLKNG